MAVRCLTRADSNSLSGLPLSLPGRRPAWLDRSLRRQGAGSNGNRHDLEATLPCAPTGSLGRPGIQARLQGSLKRLLTGLCLVRTCAQLADVDRAGSRGSLSFSRCSELRSQH